MIFNGLFAKEHIDCLNKFFLLISNFGIGRPLSVPKCTSTLNDGMLISYKFNPQFNVYTKDFNYHQNKSK